MPVACFRQRKKPTTFVVSFVFALPIFTASHPATIVGVHELNFCVRDGNRWTLMTINTNSYGWVLPIFYIKILYRILIPFLVTRTGFEPMLKA